MAEAELVLWHGLYLEAQMEEFLLDLGTRKPVLAVGETVPKDRLIGDPEYADRFDPHLWFDPDLWALAVDGVQKALDDLIPAAAETHAANAAAFKTEAAAIGAYARDVLASVPAEARILVTAHDAFGYFGRAYGFEVEGVQGLSTESEAGLQRISELVDLLVTRKIPSVFVESSVSDRAVRALIEGAEARGQKVSIGGELFSDAMGAEGTYEGTWTGMIDHNVTLIARALGGEAPERGMTGRLSAGT
jgi:manganese/zinc/iron transport system substrate-binding protein